MAVVEQPVVAAEVVEAPAVEEELAADADAPRQPRSMLPDDWWAIGGSALAALSLAWVVFYRVLPLQGAVGFWVVTWLGFVAIYWFTVRTMAGGLTASDRVVAVVLSSAALALFGVLLLIVGWVVVKGVPGITAAFFTQTLEDVGPLDPESKGGAAHAFVGTLEQLGLTVLIAVPLGVTTAVFLNEVGGRMAGPVRTLVDAMSGVPSIVAGLFVYTSLVLQGGWGFSGFAAALALAVLMLPTVTRACEVVLRLVPSGLREAAYALGAPRWRVVLQVVLPTARSGVSTAGILGMARSVGETAPLILTAFGAAIMNANAFDGPQESLPLYIWHTVRNADLGQVRRGQAAALALVVLVLVLFVLARYLGRSHRARGAVTPPSPAEVARLDPAFDLGGRDDGALDPAPLDPAPLDPAEESHDPAP